MLRIYQTEYLSIFQIRCDGKRHVLHGKIRPTISTFLLRAGEMYCILITIIHHQHRRAERASISIGPRVGAAARAFMSMKCTLGNPVTGVRKRPRMPLKIKLISYSNYYK